MVTLKKLSEKALAKATVMTTEQMQAVTGGAQSFTCYCGFVDNPQSSEIKVTAPGLTDALTEMGKLCNGAGATCNGN